eukprot:TRINITY_DN707_c0_g1_i1.p1 TRINITY_DN707_c0_g1~~TRINITY_DN707_c0_g1_i1.p1  ORF type:complete len:302 (+),score=106.74 TRINITY_DN707_c0_g1_i1:69-908(+)
MTASPLALAVLLLALACACTAQRSTPPNVQGRWDDRVCHLVPNSRQLYQRRTYVFSAVSPMTKGGTYEISTSFFSRSACEARQEVYRTVVTGNFQLGSRSANLERFWKVDYAIGEKRMEVFSTQFGREVSALAGCDFPEEFVPNVVQDVTEVVCPELNLIPKSDCPLEFDVARRDKTTLWVGASFQGQPPQYKSNCRKIDRHLEYDPYSFVQFGAEEEPMDELIEDPETFMLTNYVDPQFDPDEVLSDNIDTEVSSAASAVGPSALFACAVAIALRMFM